MTTTMGTARPDGHAAPVRSGAAGRAARPPSGRAAALPPEQRRADIIAAAAPLLRSRGHDVTTKQIAEAAGIAEGTVFRAFPSKQAIVDAVLADACDQSGTIARIRDIDLASPLPERVRECAAVLNERLASMIDLMIALRMHGPPPSGTPGPPGTDGTDGKDGSGHGPSHSRHHRHRHQQSELIAAVTAVFEPDAARLCCPPQRAAHLLRLLTFSGTHRMINDDNPLTAAEVADVLLHGIVRAASDPTAADRRPAGREPAERAEPPPGRGH